MEEPANLNPLSSPPFPPGVRFFPSDHELVRYYLASKNSGDLQFGVDVIKELDLYNLNPLILPEITCFRFGRGGRRRHWYCYTARVLHERKNRKCGGGFWKRNGRVRDVVSEGALKVVVGTRKRFVFHLGNSIRRAIKTNWIMYEYALIHPLQASFVVCRVFVRSTQQRNNISKQISGSSGEIGATKVRHIGIQNDGASTSRETEAKSPDEKHVDPINNAEPVAEQIRAPHVDWNNLTDEEISAIEDGFFIELADLSRPLPGAD